jgi:hypothetical protein
MKIVRERPVVRAAGFRASTAGRRFPHAHPKSRTGGRFAGVEASRRTGIVVFAEADGRANWDLSKSARRRGKKMRGIAKATIELALNARMLLAADHPQTLRRLHYALFSAAIIPYENTQADYKRLSRATTVPRRAYRDWELGKFPTEEPANSIPPEWMVDETRNPEVISVWDDPVDYVETVKEAYRRDNWQDQPNYCEVWSEKGTILGAIRSRPSHFVATKKASVPASR